MKRNPPFWSRAVWPALLIALLAVSAFGQSPTGSIFGTVAGNDGAVLPGVTVTLSGVGAAQNVVTDGQGRFRFINLSPGSYTLKAELSGYGTSTRTGLTVSIGRNAEVAMTLNPSVSQSITVTAEAPLLDVRKTGTGSTVPRVELEKVPSARDPWVILQQTPGVTMDRNNVGGNESGQQSVYVSKGTTGTQSTWNVDGVNITDFAATGSSPTYYDFDAFDEMQITTGGTDPSIQTAGVQVNVVTKRGTNDFTGSARSLHTSGSYQADPKIPSEATYLTFVNEINKIDDQGGEVGGPIIKDRLWFWGAYGKQKIDILTASIIAGARFHDKTELKNENVKFNAQVTPGNSLTLVDQFGAKVKLGRNVSPSRLPASAWNQDNNYKDGTGSLTDPTLWKIEDTQLFGPNLYLTALYSEVQGGFQLIADNGKGCQSFACGVDSQPSYFDEKTGAWTRSYFSVTSLRPQKQYRLDGSAFLNTGSLSHELKFGYGYREADVTSVTAWPGDHWTDDYSAVGGVGDGGTGIVNFTRFPILTFSEKTTDLYVGDTILMGNLTIQGGLRYDLQKGGNSAGTASANAVVPEVLPAITFPAATGLKWDDISPRIGLTYALGAERRTLLRGAYSRYVDQLTSGTVTPTSPGAYANIYYYFNDLNGDHAAQHNEVDFAYGNVGFSGFDPAHPTAVGAAFTRWAGDLVAPHTDELIFGVEREVLSDLSFGVNLTWRKLNDFVGTIGEHTQGKGDYYTSADYVLHDPVQATLPNGKKVSLPYYTLRPGLSPAVYSVIRNVPDYSQTYKGLEFTATKRMANRWMVRGNLTLQDWTQDAGPDSFGDPTKQRVAGVSACPQCDTVAFRSTGSGAKGNIYINSKWTAALTGLYQIPVIETSLGFNINSRQGYSLPYVWLVRPAGEGTKSLIAGGDVDSFRNPTVTEVDLRVAKEIRFHDVGLTISIDGFNMLNANTVLQRNVNQLNASANSANLSGTSNRITEVLSPRVFRLGARLSF